MTRSTNYSDKVWKVTHDHFVAERLADPLKWRKSYRVLVKDPFQEFLTNEQIAAVFGVMAACPQHTFQVLTKRAKRMREWFEWLRNQSDPFPAGALDYLDDTATDALAGHYDCCHLNLMASCRWPLPNVHLGVSVESQAEIERILELLATPSAVRFVAAEPLLGPLNLFAPCPPHCRPFLRSDRIAWVIAGCESGPGARPCSVEWLRLMRDQCAAAGVPFFLKQARENFADVRPAGGELSPDRVEVVGFGHGSKRKSGGVIELPYLDGVQHTGRPGTQ